MEKLSSKIIEVNNDKDILNNLNFRGLFLVKNFRVSSEMIKLISNKESAFLIDFNELGKVHGPKKGILVAQIRDFLKFCLKYNSRFCIKCEGRTEEEIVSIGSLVGLNEGQVRFALKEIENYK